MYGFLLGLLILDGLLLSVVVLLQAGKGGGLAAMGGGAAATEGLFGGRQATTMLTRATWTTGSIFMALSLTLAVLSSRAQQPQSILEFEAPAAETAPQPVLNLSTPEGDAGSTGNQGGGTGNDPGNDNGNN